MISTDIDRVAWHAAQFLEGLTRPPSVKISLSADLQDTHDLQGARSAIAAGLGVDIGFDMGNEGFSSALGLILSPRPRTARQHRFTNLLTQRLAECRRRRRYSFFTGATGFAADTDCTSMALAALIEHTVLAPNEAKDVARELMAAKALKDGERLHAGVFMVYWDDWESGAAPRGCKHDPVACANTVYAVKLAGELDRSSLLTNLRYLLDHLLSGRYLGGTRYYLSPEVFLWAMARLCHRFPDCAALLAAPLRPRVEAARPSSPLDLALKIITADYLGLRIPRERHTNLVRYQQPDGSWPACALYRMGRLPVYFGSSFLTTSFALRALVGVHDE